MLLSKDEHIVTQLKRGRKRNAKANKRRLSDEQLHLTHTRELRHAYAS